MKTVITVLAAGACLALGGCSDEPSESAMKDALARTIGASYRQHTAAMPPAGSRSPAEPVVTAFRSYGCVPATGAAGYVCEIDFALNGIDQGKGRPRFFKLPDGTLSVADR